MDWELLLSTDLNACHKQIQQLCWWKTDGYQTDCENRCYFLQNAYFRFFEKLLITGVISFRHLTSIKLSRQFRKKRAMSKLFKKLLVEKLNRLSFNAQLLRIQMNEIWYDIPKLTYQQQRSLQLMLRPFEGILPEKSAQR